MGNNEHEVMADKQRAERIKKVILEHSTYEELAEKTGISVSTLVRIASGKTEPKFSDIIQIAKITGADLNTLAYGYALDVKEEATERKLITSADGYTDEETTTHIISSCGTSGHWKNKIFWHSQGRFLP